MRVDVPPRLGYNDNTSATYHIRTHLQQLENTISSLAQEVSNIGKEISSIKAIATTAKANTEYLTSEDYQYTIAEKVKEWNRCDRILDIAKEVKEDVDVNAEEAGLEQKRLEGLAESVKISLASVSTKVEYIKSTQYRRWMSELTAQYVREDMKDTVTALMKEVQEVMEEAKKNMKTDQETRLDQMIASISAEVKDIQSIHYQRNISAFTAEYVREDMEETVKTLRKEVQEAMKEAKKEMKTVEEVRLNQIDKGEDDWERFLRVNIEPLIWAPLRRRWSKSTFFHAGLSPRQLTPPLRNRSRL